MGSGKRHSYPMSGMQVYTVVLIASLYLCLGCKFIPLSWLKVYTYVWTSNLYLCLVFFIMPISGFFQIWFKAFIPTSGLQYYTYVCYGYFWSFQIWFLTCYTYVWSAKLYLHLLCLILLLPNMISGMLYLRPVWKKRILYHRPLYLLMAPH